MNKGLSLYLAILIMAIMLALVLGLTTISVSQLRITREIENSVITFYAADTGIEQALKAIIYDQESILAPSYNGTIDIGAGANNPTYWADVVCCSFASNPDCNFDNIIESCPFGFAGEDPYCSAARYCVRSQGTYRGTKRAIEVTYGVRLATP